MSRINSYARRAVRVLSLAALLLPLPLVVQAADESLPIADTHVHYSHDSVELTPPERVIEIMRGAGLKFALVSSSDDNGTQLLSNLAPDLIVPGLRPYRRRGELGTWFKDPAALAYVESLLEKNLYASIGEFHLYGSDVELPIPKRIVELAAQHNLILHAHSDADAVDRLLAQNENVKVLWAHSGFAEPDEIAAMLGKHDRLWADLAFRSDVGSGGSLSESWKALFMQFPDRMMLGTDTYTPERMYFIPEHAEAARIWLQTLPTDIATNVAWKNGYDLIMAVWQQNQLASGTAAVATSDAETCEVSSTGKAMLLEGKASKVVIMPTEDIKVSQPFSVDLILCSELPDIQLSIDASMPMHGHGMNYTPELSELASASADGSVRKFRVDGLNFHMPGKWQWSVDIESAGSTETLVQVMELK